MESFDPALLIPLFIGGFIAVTIIKSIRISAKRGQKIWEYEANLFADPNDKDLGELEIKKFTNGPLWAELKIYGTAANFDGRVSIDINDRNVAELDVTGNGKHIHVVGSYEPSEEIESAVRRGPSYYFPVFKDLTIQHGDEATVHVPKLPPLKGNFVRD